MQTIDTPSSKTPDALLTICLFAAFADGEKSDFERNQVIALSEELGVADVAALSREILMRRTSLEAAVANLATEEDRLLAYEMALGVCEAGGSITAEETEFLATLKQHLHVPEAEVAAVQENVDQVALSQLPPPLPVDAAPAVVTPPPVAGEAKGNDGMILRYSILNGALELLPESLATIAIIPLQMKMVYRIGTSHGIKLDQAHVKEFLAAAGIGIGSQLIEGFARKLMRKFGKQVGGKMAGNVADQATGSAFTFGTTYALGQLADWYYGNGRSFDTTQIKDRFANLKAQATQLYDKYSPDIQERAKTLKSGSIVSLLTSANPA